MTQFMCPISGCGFLFRGAEAIAVEEMGICTHCQGVFREDAPQHLKSPLRVQLHTSVPLGVSR